MKKQIKLIKEDLIVLLKILWKLMWKSFLILPIVFVGYSQCFLEPTSMSKGIACGLIFIIIMWERLLSIRQYITKMLGNNINKINNMYHQNPR